VSQKTPIGMFLLHTKEATVFAKLRMLSLLLSQYILAKTLNKV
jgi:hypothetical protein